MPAAKICRNDVAEAIRVLKHQGIPDPGVHRLRTYLGRGSVTTIARFKNELRQIELEKVAHKNAKPLPDPISRLAKRVWDELLSAVEATEDELASITQRRIDEKQQQIDESEARRNQALAQISDLSEKLLNSEKRAEQQQSDIQRLKIRLGQLEGQLNANTISLHNQLEREQQLKGMLAEAANQSAIRENKLNEQLTQERNRGFELQRNADHRHQELEEQISVAREMISSDREHNERSLSSAREKIHALETCVKSQNLDLETQHAEKARLAEKLEDLNTLMIELEKQKTSLQAELVGKNDTIDTLSQRLQELQNLHLESKHHYERSITQLEMHLSDARKAYRP